MKSLFKVLKILLITLVGLALGVYLFLTFLMRFPVPVENKVAIDTYNRQEIAPNHFQVQNSWLRKNKHGIWEMYLEGDAYERGVVYGVLSKELMEKQEEAFVNQIKDMVPNEWLLRYLKYFIAWFNRSIYTYIPTEYLEEIYGISQSFSSRYNFIGEPYFRILNYHAAHDIGHALVDMNMVGCTSFAVNADYSADSSLLIGRNFDFNMGEAFAEDKLLVFLNPTKGYKLAFYTWAGFMGVVSGMNEKGLTVTLNAAKSTLPLGAKQPVSLLAREILQNCATIQEAYELAQKRETFVAESLLIGSAIDDAAAIIEKSPDKIGLYTMEKNRLICSNHYQSSVFLHDSLNTENIRLSDSQHRFTRVEELLDQQKPLSVHNAVEILRDQKGVGGQWIGYANPKAINQLLVHHSIVFKPHQKQLWVSTKDYQMGEFIAYDLDEVFENADSRREITSDNNVILPDSTFTDQLRSEVQYFRTFVHQVQLAKMARRTLNFSEKEIEQFLQSNPDSYLTYVTLGDYYAMKGLYHEAKAHYALSLKKEVASQKEIEAITGKMTSILSTTTNR